MPDGPHAQNHEIERSCIYFTERGKSLDYFPASHLVVVSHSTGFVKPDFQQMSLEIREKLESSGACVLTCQHALGGVNRAVRKKLDTYQLDEIVAYTLSLFGQGTKVAVDIVLMEADS